jgi:glycosyltransferase involved in cell wall biosynthesis
LSKTLCVANCSNEAVNFNLDWVETITKQQNKISVIIAMHNHEKSIVKSINSILNQSYKNVEIIVVDCNSDDNGYNLVKDMKKNIKLIQSKFNCILKGRMVGIKDCESDYICFQEADGYSFSNKISNKMNDFLKYNGKMSLGKPLIEELEIIENVQLDRFRFAPCLLNCSSIFKKDLFNNYSDNKLSNLELVPNCNCIVCNNDVFNINIDKEMSLADKIYSKYQFEYDIKYEHYENNSDSILAVNMHFNNNKTNYLNNFFEQIELKYVDLIILIYSKNSKFDLTNKKLKKLKKNINHKNIIILNDKTNMYLDFGKKAICYYFIKINNIKYKWIHFLNDSIIPTHKLDNIFKKIEEAKHNFNFIGICETIQISHHYQSWWLFFDSECLDYYINEIEFGENTHDYAVTKNEILLCQKMICIYKSCAIFPLVDIKFCHNLFFDDDKLYNEYYKNGFYFIKVKRIQNDPVRQNLIIYNDNYQLRLKNIIKEIVDS